MNQKLYDAILGFAIGDALGVPYEFKERGSFTCSDMTSYGTHYQPLGTWSDDTSMTLASLSKTIKSQDLIAGKSRCLVLADSFNCFHHIIFASSSPASSLRDPPWPYRPLYRLHPADESASDQ